MYYPVGWHKVLKLDTQCNQEQCEILSVQANHERELFYILTTKSIHIWFTRPVAEIVCHKRSKESIEKLGLNRLAVWRPDSSVIVVATERDQLLFYQVQRRLSSSSATTFFLPNSSASDGIYRLRYDSKNIKKMLNNEPPPNTSESEQIAALTLFSFGKLDLSSVGVSCLMSAEEELIVGSHNGQIYGVHWNGNVDEKFPWSLSKEVQNRSDFLVDIKFSIVLSGFALVFRSGRVGFMPLRIGQEKLENGDIEKISSNTSISYLAGIKDATCAEINHRHRLVAFGLKNSKVIVCNIGESDSLVINHTLDMGTCQFPHDSSRLGRVQCLRYSPDNFALVTSWEGGEFAIWSVFGSLLFCTQQWHVGSDVDVLSKPVRVTSLAWGREGFNLWLCIARDDCDDQDSIISSSVNGKSVSDEERSRSTTNSSDAQQKDEVRIMSLAHCNLSSSPHLTCSSDSLVLMAEERLYVGPSTPHEDNFDHWMVINLPQTYLNAQYPIRYATIDRECKNLAIAGNKGLALYSITADKWKFFAKKSHEDNFSICGDIIWWRAYLVGSCFNFESESFELRAYPTDGNLDNVNVIVQAISMEIIRMSIFENRLLVLYSDGTLGMFMLNLRSRPSLKRPERILVRSDSIVSASGRMTGLAQQNSPRSNRSDSIVSWSHPLGNSSSNKEIILQISPIENLVISDLQANPFCISSISLTRLHFKNNRQDDSILLNACGKLFLLEREAPPDLSSSSPISDLSSPDLRDLSIDSHKSTELEIKVNSAKIMSNSVHFASASLKNTANEPSALSNVTFKAVSVIATNVEQFWISPEISNASDMSYFKKSLWLSCGGSNNRLQVWLPLLNDKNDPPTDLYVPDRIMLPIRCDIYPLAIRSSAPNVTEPDDAIVLGAESDVLYRDCKLFTNFPYSTVKRQCRVYLHRILRELLLSQHLGYYAKKIAETCQSLPYFAHCFELLLHEVLEEEATSPVPLPDPMLPQIVRFIKEFPVYLETVVHCARKSELSMWSHLFDERAVGNPRRLFQECIEKHKLDTAVSCLMILQSLDKSIVSSRMVKELIKAARDDPKFEFLVDDLESFFSRAELDDRSQGTSPGSPNV